MLIKISSENEKLSYLIHKNPENMYSRNIRSGILFGFFNEKNYFLFFKDSPNEISYKQYKEEQFEFLNTTRFNSSICAMQCIYESLKDSIIKPIKEDIEVKQNIEFSAVSIKNMKNFDKLLKYFDINYEIKDSEYKTYNIMFSKSNSTFQKFIGEIFTILLFIALDSDEFVEINIDTIKKYTKILNIIDAPYYIRYLLVSRFCFNKNAFMEVKKELENNKFKLHFMNTQNQRYEAIKNKISFKYPIIDIGSGEGFYTIPFSKKVEKYFAIDRDEKCRNKVIQEIKEENISNVCIYSDINEIEYKEKVDILLIEVIEHQNNIDESINLMKELLKINFNEIIITTPNIDFNKHYMLENFRHPDHKFELSSYGFQNIINKVFENYEKEFFNIGDEVDGISTSIGVKIKNKYI